MSDNRKSSPRRSAGRRRRRTAIVGLPLSLIFGAWQLGWFVRERPLEVATGLNALDSRARGSVESSSLEHDTLPAGLGNETEENDLPRILWLGHAGYVVSWHGVTLLLDPNIASHCTVAPRLLENALAPLLRREFAGTASAGTATAAWPRIDAVLVSHAHFDHLDRTTLESIDQGGALVLPRGSARFVRRFALRFTEIVELAEFERRDLGPLEVIAVPADHHGSRWHPLRSRRLAVGYVVRHGSSALYFAGDTGIHAPFARIAEQFAPRIAILPIGAHSPRWPIGRVHLNPEQAVDVARLLGASWTVPAHFATFRLALDDPRDALPRFARAAEIRSIAWWLPRLATPADFVGESL